MPYIILDRDGVINYDSYAYIKNPDEWMPIPGSLAAIARLNKHGYRVLVATNQSGIARGLYDVAMLDAIHEKMLKLLAAEGGYIEEIFFCPHHPDEKCHCRKPQPGMIEQIKAKYPIIPAETYFIGDTKTDIEVAEATGLQPILVLTEKGQRDLKAFPVLQQTLQFADLAAAVDYILASHPREKLFTN